MSKKINPKNSESQPAENAPLKDEEATLSKSAQARQDARLHAVGDASDRENVTEGHNQREKGGSEFGPDQFPSEDSASVKARRERLINGPVGDASEATDGKTYGTSDNKDAVKAESNGK